MPEQPAKKLGERSKYSHNIMLVLCWSPPQPLIRVLLENHTFSKKLYYSLLYLISFSNVVSLFSFLKQPLPGTEELPFQETNTESLIYSIKRVSLSKSIWTEMIAVFWKLHSETLETWAFTVQIVPLSWFLMKILTAKHCFQKDIFKGTTNTSSILFPEAKQPKKRPEVEACRYIKIWLQFFLTIHVQSLLLPP